MTAQQDQLQAIVKETIDLQLSALPQTGQVGVLAQQIAKISESLTAEQRQLLINALSPGKLDAEAPRDLTQPQSVTAQRDGFLEKYKISELGSSQVALTLPAGTTRIEFLKEAQELSIALHASNPENYKVNQAVYPNRLESWKSERGFTEATENEISLKIDGNVKGSTNHTRREQEREGWNDVALQDLAVAHTAFYLLTGKDLFEGNIVRAAGGALYFLSPGLDVYYYLDAIRSSHVSASRSLPVPN